MVTPSTAPPTGNSETKSPGSPSMAQAPRPPTAPMRSDARTATGDDHLEALEPGVGQQQQVGQGVLGADHAEGTEDDDASDSALERGEQAQLHVALVLVAVHDEQLDTKGLQSTAVPIG